MSCTKYAKLRIVRLFGLFLLFFGSAASAEISKSDLLELETNVQRILDQFNENIPGSFADDVTYYLTLQYDALGYDGRYSNTPKLSTDIQSIGGDISLMTSDIADIADKLNNINGYLTGTMYNGLRNTLEREIAVISNGNNRIVDALGNLVVSNVVVVAVSNVPTSVASSVNGNPWWHTNSAFVIQKDMYSKAYPNEIPNSQDSFSFPQFMSLWGAKLNQPGATGAASISSGAWVSMWGKDSWTRWFSNHRQPSYTWFDWMSDAMRSNWVLQANAGKFGPVVSSLETLGYNISSNVDENAEYMLNRLGVYLDDTTNHLARLASAPSLFDNPWWYTNSDFVVSWQGYEDVFPVSPRGGIIHDIITFPQAFSAYSSWFNSGIAFYDDPSRNPFMVNFLYDQFGSSKFGEGGLHQGQAYTFFDWLADYYKSNLVLTTSSSYSSLTNEIAQQNADFTDGASITNVPFPQYELPEVSSMEEAEDTLDSAQSTIEDLLDSIPKPGTSGDPEIVLIPEFTVGGIHVREYKASLSSPIVGTCRSVLSFIYGVGLFCWLWVMCKDQFAYFVTLGRYWGRS